MQGQAAVYFQAEFGAVAIGAGLSLEAVLLSWDREGTSPKHVKTVAPAIMKRRIRSFNIRLRVFMSCILRFCFGMGILVWSAIPFTWIINDDCPEAEVLFRSFLVKSSPFFGNEEG